MKRGNRKKYPCVRCGTAPKLPGQGKRYCAECEEAARWRRERKRATRGVVRRSPCQLCHGVKEPGHGRRYCKRCADARKVKPHCRDCGTEIKAPKKLCAACRYAVDQRLKTRNRLRNARWRKNNPAGKRKPTTAEQRQDRRINYVLKYGQSKRKLKPREKDGMDRVHLSAAPLAPYLRERLLDTGVNLLGEAAHVRAHTIQGIADGTVERIAVGSADRLCVALGLNITNVYPEWHSGPHSGLL